MMKKLLILGLVMMMALAGISLGAAESEKGAEVLTAAELTEWAEGLKALAMGAELLNDPTEAAAETEDGIMFHYAFGALYGDRTEMTAETRIAAVEIAEEEEASLRGLRISMTAEEVCALFPDDNPEMAGDRDGAVLYIRENGKESLAYGRVYRDGQRISAIEYGEIVPDGKGYRIAALKCLFSDGMLYEIRGERIGENPDAALTAADRDDFAAELKALDSRDEYRAVKSSRNGTELTEFAAEDLVFSGIDLMKVKPEELPGNTVEDMFDNEDGTWIKTVTGEDYEAVFRCDKKGKNTEIVSFTVTGEEMEGPRGVRLGDMYYQDLQRFRFEERGLSDDGGSEVLYGEADQVPRGIANYLGDDGITLTYVTEAGDGKTATLVLRYEMSVLSEIYLMVE